MSEIKNETVKPFKSEPVIIEFDNGESFDISFDMNAFCEMEKVYGSVDTVLQMILGTGTAPDMSKVTYCDAPCLATDIKVGGILLSEYISKLSEVPKAKHSDTLNLLWFGCLHDHTLYDDDGNVLKYTISKSHLGSLVNFRNLHEVNGKIVTSILRDLLPAMAEAQENLKNAEAAKAPILQVPDNQVK